MARVTRMTIPTSGAATAAMPGVTPPATPVTQTQRIRKPFPWRGGIGAVVVLTIITTIGWAWYADKSIFGTGGWWDTFDLTQLMGQIGLSPSDFRFVLLYIVVWAFIRPLYGAGVLARKAIVFLVYSLLLIGFGHIYMHVPFSLTKVEGDAWLLSLGVVLLSSIAAYWFVYWYGQPHRSIWMQWIASLVFFGAILWASSALVGTPLWWNQLITAKQVPTKTNTPAPPPPSAEIIQLSSTNPEVTFLLPNNGKKEVCAEADPREVVWEVRPTDVTLKIGVRTWTAKAGAYIWYAWGPSNLWRSSEKKNAHCFLFNYIQVNAATPAVEITIYYSS